MSDKEIDLQVLKNAMAIAERRYGDRQHPSWVALQDELADCIRILSRETQ